MKKAIATVAVFLALFMFATGNAFGGEVQGVLTFVWPSFGMDPNDPTNWTWYPEANQDGIIVYPSKALISIEGYWVLFDPDCALGVYNGYRMDWMDFNLDGNIDQATLVKVDPNAPPISKFTQSRGDDTGLLQCAFPYREDTSYGVPTATPGVIITLTASSTATPDRISTAVFATPTPYPPGFTPTASPTPKSIVCVTTDGSPCVPGWPGYNDKQLYIPIIEVQNATRIHW